MHRSAHRAHAHRTRTIAAVGSSAALATGAVAALVGVGPVAPAGAATITVANLDDSGPGSLRAALAAASNGDVIDLSGLTGTITLTSGPLEISDLVTITGPGADRLAISGNDNSGVFEFHPVAAGGGGTVAISGLTITHGQSFAGAGILFSCYDGGSLLPGTDLVLDGVHLVDNYGFAGPGVAFIGCYDGGRGTLSITDSLIAGNTAAYFGGGVLAQQVVGVTVTSSTVSGNLAGSYRGGGFSLSSVAHAKVRNSTVSGNVAPQGGAFYLKGTDLDLELSTVTANTNAVVGDTGAADVVAGGIFIGPPVEPSEVPTPAALADARLVPPAARVASVPSTVALVGTILAGNANADLAQVDGGDATATSTSSIVGTVDASIVLADLGGTRTGVTDPGLGPLADHGGPATFPLFPGSDFDQRGPGYARVVNGTVDVGAYEVQVETPVIPPPRFTG